MMQRIRDWIVPENSIWNNVMLAVVICDISCIALQSKSQPEYLRITGNTIGFIFNIVFISECCFKILLFGPLLYFSNSFHYLDASISVMSLLDLTLNASPIFKFASILRLVRLLRLARLARLAKLSRLVVKSTKSLSDSVLSQFDIVNIFGSVLLPIFNILVQFSVILLFAGMVGYYLFSNSTKEYTNGYLFPDISQRIGFDHFSSSLLAMYLSFTQDRWFSIMVYYSETKGEIGYIFFILWMIATKWIFQATLRSIVIIMMDYNANKLFISAAGGNERVVSRLFQGLEIHILRKYFYIFKSKTLSKSSLLISNKKEKTSNNVNDSSIDFQTKSKNVIELFLQRRKNYPFYVIDKRWKIYEYFVKILESKWFITLCEICNALLCFVGLFNVFHESKGFDAPPFALLITFGVILFFEMILKFITKGFFGYFSHKSNLMNFICNIILLVNLTYVDHWKVIILHSFRLVRIIMTIADIVDNLILGSEVEFEAVYVASLISAFGSIKSLIVVAICALFIFGIIGLQLWVGAMNYCTDENFPEGASRYYTDSEFPDGCNSYFDSQHRFHDIEWVNSDSNYDNIFKSMQSVFRTYSLNDWNVLAFTSMDSVAQDYNLERNNNIAALVLYVFMTLFSIIIATLFMGVAYYHYLIRITERETTSLLGSRSILWAAYQVSYMLIYFSLI
jgi:hypothetical protein